MANKKVLFIHHGTIAGGAPLSMLYTMRGIRYAGYEPCAALLRPSQELHELYNKEGFATIETPWIPKFITWSGSEGKRWNPLMWKGVLNAWLNWRKGKQKLKDLILRENFDIVHLNSVGLSNSASALQEMGVPFVWHIREFGPTHKGCRYSFIQERLMRAKHIIFLSAAERRSWMGGYKHGTVVHNFVDLEQFKEQYSQEDSQQLLGIPSDKKVILYVGGGKRHKGIIELLNALAELRNRRGSDFVCLMPDSQVDPLTATTTEKLMIANIADLGLKEICLLRPFDPDILAMYAACDLLVFPANRPHFARPVVEASAMGKPVIATDLPPLDEIIVDGVTGVLSPENDNIALARNMDRLLSDYELSSKFGTAGKRFAHLNFSLEGQMKKIEKVYENALSK